MVIKNRRISSVKVTDDFNNLYHKKVSPKTIIRTVKQFEINRRTARKKPYINLRNRKKRMAFANKYLSKDNTFWSRVLWSDESKFNLFGSDGHIKV
jgi:hypothetical protein